MSLPTRHIAINAWLHGIMYFCHTMKIRRPSSSMTVIGWANPSQRRETSQGHRDRTQDRDTIRAFTWYRPRALSFSIINSISPVAAPSDFLICAHIRVSVSETCLNFRYQHECHPLKSVIPSTVARIGHANGLFLESFLLSRF